MKYSTAKISLFILITVLISACNVMKKVPAGKSLLTKNEILVNGKNNNKDEIVSQIIQQPNSSLLGYKLRLNMFNLAKENTDSIFRAKYTKNPEKYKRKAKWLSKKQVDRLGKSFWYSGIHSFLLRTGEPPAVIDELKARKSVERLNHYYFTHGYFDVKAKFLPDYKENRRVNIKYTVTTGKPSFLANITREIETQSLDSLFKKLKSKSFLKQGDQYSEENIDAERARITSYFRNHGVYYFQQQSIVFEIDTATKNIPVKVNVFNQILKEGDSTKSTPYKIYKIGEVNVYTNDAETKGKKVFADSAKYKNFNLYSTKKYVIDQKQLLMLFLFKKTVCLVKKRGL